VTLKTFQISVDNIDVIVSIKSSYLSDFLRIMWHWRLE